MIPTYLIRWAAFGAAIQSSGAKEAGEMGRSANIMLIFFLVVLCVIAYQRGKAVAKKHLVAFPVVAFVFDILLPFVPLVPTVMHVVALVVGVPDARRRRSSRDDDFDESSTLDDSVIDEAKTGGKLKNVGISVIGFVLSVAAIVWGYGLMTGDTDLRKLASQSESSSTYEKPLKVARASSDPAKELQSAYFSFSPFCQSSVGTQTAEALAKIRQLRSLNAPVQNDAARNLARGQLMMLKNINCA